MPTRLPVRPWSEVKSHRGAPKHIATQGYACANPACAYFGITDAKLHALVGDGTHGKCERIQTFRRYEWRWLNQPIVGRSELRNAIGSGRQR
jgi:hypothetical protein